MRDQRFQTVLLPDGDEPVRYRQISFSVTVNDEPYRVYVAKSLNNTDHIIRSIIFVSALTILLLLVANFVINRWVLQRLWRPFYKTMTEMKAYRLGGTAFPEFSKTDIEEFNALNETLSATIRHAENEYLHLKEFTENASHEMQTPVAVIRSKMDVLIQDAGLSEAQSKMVQDAYAAIDKLTQLNRSLLLLSRIENRQFAEKQKLSLKELLREKISFFNEMLQNKKLNVSADIENIQVEINPALADILLNNLLGNCIRHSPPDAEIKISLTEHRLAFCNGPVASPLDRSNIFTRFHKGLSTSGQHGLGLAIVKEICNASGFDIEYLFQHNMQPCHGYSRVYL